MLPRKLSGGNHGVLSNAFPLSAKAQADVVCIIFSKPGEKSGTCFYARRVPPGPVYALKKSGIIKFDLELGFHWRKIKKVALSIRVRATTTQKLGEPLISGVPERAAIFICALKKIPITSMNNARSPTAIRQLGIPP